MSLFSRLFPKKEAPAAQATPAPKANTSFTPPKPGIVKIPRAARIQLSPLHGLRCRVQLAGQFREVPVANLSSSGIGFLKLNASDHSEWPPLKSPIQGTLGFPKAGTTELIPFDANLIHFSAQVIGARFSGETRAIAEEVQRYFKVELGALRMSKVSPDMLRKDADGEPNWSYGDNGCEIFFLTRDSKIVRFNLAFFGNYAEGGEGKKTRFGQIVAGDTSKKLQYKGSEEIRWDSDTPPDLQLNAVRFVESVSHLAPEERAAIIALLRS